MTLIAAPREKVWEALSTAEFTRRYRLSTRVASSWVQVSEVLFMIDGDNGNEVSCRGKILIADKPNELSCTWSFPNNPAVSREARSRVTFRLEPLEDHTRLSITHDRFPQDSVMYDSVKAGWPLALGGLKKLLETGRTVDFSRF